MSPTHLSSSGAYLNPKRLNPTHLSSSGAEGRSCGSSWRQAFIRSIISGAEDSVCSLQQQQQQVGGWGVCTAGYVHDQRCAGQ